MAGPRHRAEEGCDGGGGMKAALAIAWLFAITGLYGGAHGIIRQAKMQMVDMCKTDTWAGCPRRE